MKDGIVMELCASENKIDREAQEAFAEEIVPVEIPQRKGDPVVVDTEMPLEGIVQPQPR